MNLPPENADFFFTLQALQRLLARFDERGMIIGGLAASLLGKPRWTADADAVFLLDDEEIPHLIEAARQEGLTPRVPDVEEFARQNRVLLLQHEASDMKVDIALGILAFEMQAIERSRTHQFGTLTVRLPAPEDLIIMKAIAHRPKDLEDIRGILARQPNLDRERIRRGVTEFAAEIGAPELWEDIASWF